MNNLRDKTFCKQSPREKGRGGGSRALTSTLDDVFGPIGNLHVTLGIYVGHVSSVEPALRVNVVVPVVLPPPTTPFRLCHHHITTSFISAFMSG